jgi:phosphohistidine phosphatase
MARHLYLMRHAQSVEKQIGQRDETRELTPEGIKEALLIGNYLFQQKISPDCILCSPAERAKTTASLVSDALKVDPERIMVQEELYEASTRTFFQFVGSLEDFRGTILCIGHNPAISYLAEY